MKTTNKKKITSKKLLVGGLMALSLGMVAPMTHMVEAHAETSAYNQTLAKGFAHNLIVKPDGTVWAWGSNESGRLGDGTTTDRTTPVQVKNLTDVKEVTGGAWHSLALKNDGTVWAWGNGSQGQIGDGSSSTRLTPVQVKGLTDVVAIASENHNNLAVKKDGTVWGWGDNYLSVLGDGTSSKRYTPVQVRNLTDVIAVSISSDHALALKKDGTVWAWGNNINYGLGDGTTTLRTTPVQVRNLTDVVSIEAGEGSSYAVKKDGTAYSWGRNSYGELGDGSSYNRSTPVQVKNLTNVKSIESGTFYAMALKNDGTVWHWGSSSNYGLSFTNVPVQKTGVTDVMELIANTYYPNGVFALKTDGTLSTWGKVATPSPVSMAGTILLPTELAVDSVESQVQAINDLFVQLNVSLTQTDLDSAFESINALPDSYEGKTDLLNQATDFQAQLNVQSLETEVAQADLTSLDTLDQFQVKLDSELTSVNEDVTNTEVKEALVQDLGQVQETIYDSKATVFVMQSEEMVSVDLTTMDQVEQAQSKLDTTSTFVNEKVQKTSVKSALTTRMATVQTKIYESKGSVYVKNVEAYVESGLPTMEHVNEAQGQLDTASDFIESYVANEDVKSSLTGQLEVVQEKVYEGKATVLVVDAETLLTEPSLQTAEVSVDVLKNAEVKENLSDRLDVVEEKINEAKATSLVKQAESLLSEEAIKTAQVSLEFVQNTEVKTELLNRLAVVQEKVNEAKATNLVKQAETTLTLQAVQSAEASLELLTNQEVKLSLQERLNKVKEVNNATENTKTVTNALNDYQDKLASMDLSNLSNSDLSSLENKLSTVQSQTSALLDQLHALSQSDMYPAMQNQVKELLSQVTELNDRANVLSEIVTKLSDSYRNGNGNADYRFKINNNVNIYDKVNLTTELGEKEGIDFLSINPNIATVDQNGYVTILHNGIAKVVAYSDQGYVEIYFVISGKR